MVYLGSVQFSRRPRFSLPRAVDYEPHGFPRFATSARDRRLWAQQMLVAGAMAAGAILAVAGVMLLGMF